MSPHRRFLLKEELIKAYWAASTPNELRLVRLLFWTLGFADPLHGTPSPLGGDR